MLNLPDEENQDFDNFEEEETASTQGMSTRVTKSTISQRSSTPTSVSHNININYRHCYTVEKTDGEEIDIPALLQSLAQHTTAQSPSKILQSTKLKQSDPSSPSRPKTMSLYLTHSNKTITFTALDISDPPHLTYSDDLDALPAEWEKSSYLVIKGVPIALKYWSQVFRWARPEAWSVIKNSWTNWKVRHLHLMSRCFRKAPFFLFLLLLPFATLY
jgi:hypothetical protein